MPALSAINEIVHPRPTNHAQSHVQLSDAELAAYRHMRDKLKAFEGIEDIYDNVPDDGELDAQPEQQQQKQKR